MILLPQSLLRRVLGVAILATLLGSTARADLIGFYPFDDAGTPLVDESPGGNNATIGGGTPVHQPAGGYEGGAYLFNGGISRLHSPININPSVLPNMTIGAWVKPNAGLGSGLYKWMGHDNGGWDRTIGLDNRGIGGFRYTAFRGNGDPVANTVPYTGSQWVFMAVAYNNSGNTMTLYIDGDATSTADAVQAFPQATGFNTGQNTFAIGAIRPDNGSEPWLGLIDNVFVYNETLPASAITAIRDGGRNQILGAGPDDPNLRILSSAPLPGDLGVAPPPTAFDVMVDNTGETQDLTFTEPTISGPDMEHFSVDSFPASIAAGAADTIGLIFDPIGEQGDFTATLTIHTNDPTTPDVQFALGASVFIQPPPGELRAFYSFDDEAAPLKDDSGNGNDLTNVGAVWSASGGHLAGGYNFNGSNRLVAPVNINPAVMPTMTMGAWVRTSTLVPERYKVMGHDDGAWDRTIGLDHRTAAATGGLPNLFRYTAFTGIGATGPVENTPAPVNTSDWTFLAATYDNLNGIVSVFVDLDVSTTADPLSKTTAAADPATGHATLSIGSLRPDNNTEGWQGDIDNAFVYSGVLTDAELTALRDGGLEGVLSPSIEFFRSTPGHIASGESVTLEWSTSFANTLEIDNGVPAISGDIGTIIVSPTTTTTYTLTASNSQSSSMAEVTVGVDVTPLPPVITEFMASNDGVLDDGDGNSPDWIELTNPNAYAINLLGYGLMDDTTTWLFPDVQLEAGEYLIVFASGQLTDDYVDAGGFLHTNFALSADGEALKLIDPDGSTVIQEFTSVPGQFADISWGTPGGGGSERFFSPSSPGAPNGPGFIDFVKDTKFSVPRGFYDAAFDTVITSSTPGATIIYTTDGSEPSDSNGTAVSAADANTPGEATVNIAGTTTLRAFATRPDFAPTNIDTLTYLFASEIIAQPPAPAGLPLGWGVFTGVNGGATGQPVPADYAMNPAIVNPDQQGMIDALKALPSISIVGDHEDLFGINGILQNPFGGVNGTGVFTTPTFERNRRCSIEIIDPNGGPEVQADAGIRISGGWSRHYIASPKKSFSLLFRHRFGDKKLDFPLFGEDEISTFDRVILRACFSNAWPDAARPPEYIRDHFLRDSQLDMGQPSTRSSWCHLYINGLYWGVYNPTERADADYASDHFGGRDEDYDAVKHSGLTGPGAASNNSFEVIDGEAAAYQAALSTAASGLANPANYDQFQQLVDVDNLIDYILVNCYMANVDWPHKNWYANRLRAPGAGWRFYCWDSEYACHDLGNNRFGVNNANTPAALYAAARSNAEFRQRFGDRAHMHMFNDGVLQPGPNQARYQTLIDEVEPAIVAEAARWGDNSFTRQGATNYMKSNWISATQSVLNFLGARHGTVLSQLRGAGLYPNLDAPAFSQHGGNVPIGFQLAMSGPSTVYYTTDGTDPRLEGGTINGSAVIADAGTITQTTLLAAGASCTATVPADNSLALTWTAVAFDDATWLTGTSGVGYDNNPDYGPEIGLDVDAVMDGVNTSIFARLEFNPGNTASFNALTLKMKYDDGFIAYLNGVKIAEANAPSNPAWNSEATADHADSSALVFQPFDITNHLGDLIPNATNVLAIHGLNRFITSSDFLLTPEIEGVEVTGGTPITLNASGPIRARSYNGSIWSALNEALFIVGVEANASNLAITEFSYRPAEPTLAEDPGGLLDRGHFEFVELLNLSATDTIELTGVVFTAGIAFDFGASSITQLAPGARVLIVSDLAAFQTRYPGVSAGIIAGEFTGALDNAGEQLVLSGPSGDIHNFTYNDNPPWPTSADGDGFSLVLRDPHGSPDYNDGTSWRSSTLPNGNPGDTDSVPFGGGDPALDDDRDGLNALTEAFLGTSESDGASGLDAMAASFDIDSHLVFSFQRNLAADDLHYEVQISDDLELWNSGPNFVELVGETSNGDGTSTVVWRSVDAITTDMRAMMRLLISQRLP